MHVVFSLETGGLENGVVNLCNRLDPDRFHPSISVFRGGGTLEARLDIDRVDILEVKRYRNNDLTLPLRLAWHLRRRHIDILHTHSWGTLVEGVVAAKLARTPLIIHGEHGTIEERPRNIRIQRALWTRTHQITAVSVPLADRLAQAIGFSRKQIQVIPNGVDTDRFHPQKDSQTEYRRLFGLPPTGLLIGMVARLVPIKNHLGMLYALARLKAIGVQVNLALAGDGPLQDELQQAACDLKISERVHLLGEVGPVEKFLNALNLFVLNSHAEGMSNTILEAMACGLPVVATAVGANPSLVANEQTGYLIPADNVDALSNAIAGFAKDDALEKAMGSAGRTRIEQHFGMDKMVQDYSSLYEKLITNGHPNNQRHTGIMQRRHSRQT